MDASTQSDAETLGQRLWFENDSIARNDVSVEAIKGREAISQPYRFEATLVSHHAVKAADVIGQRATLGIDVGEDKLVVHGVVVEFEADDPTYAGDFVYRLTLAPRLKLLE